MPFFYYGVADQIKLFVLSLALDQISGIIFGLRQNSYLGLKIKIERWSTF